MDSLERKFAALEQANALLFADLCDVRSERNAALAELRSRAEILAANRAATREHDKHCAGENRAARLNTYLTAISAVTAVTLAVPGGTRTDILRGPGGGEMNHIRLSTRVAIAKACMEVADRLKERQES